MSDHTDRPRSGYQLGIDLGTTYTAATVCRDGEPHPQPLPLATAAASVASVVFLASDGTWLVGEAAARRALTDPARVAREFKRRIGDGIPVTIGDRAVPAEELAARFVAWVVAQATDREGGPADAVAITHPAEWGAHKRSAFAAALSAQGLDDVAFRTEPQAAAIGYASTARVRPGGVVAVYDLGGGTFDAAVVRKTGDHEFTLLGRPTGIDRLGGVDFDQRVFDHVREVLGTAWTRLDPDDPAVRAAVAGLRRECTAAKESLSADTEVTIPVMLPGLHTRVRLGRSEFEDMIRPQVTETVEVLRRALATAGVSDAEQATVLLVGGSSRLPLVAQLVSAELGRPVAVDVDPEAVIAAGAALAARATVAPAAGPRSAVDAAGADPRDPDTEILEVVARAPAPTAEDEEPTVAPRRRRTLLVAATVAVAAMFATSATIATTSDSTGSGSTAEAAEAFAGALDGVDPWTGAEPTDTSAPGPQRPTAVAAAAPPAPRTTGARTADAGQTRATPPVPAPVPAAPAPAPTGPAPTGTATAEAEPGPGPTTPIPADPPALPPPPASEPESPLPEGSNSSAVPPATTGSAAAEPPADPE